MSAKTSCKQPGNVNRCSYELIWSLSANRFIFFPIRQISNFFVSVVIFYFYFYFFVFYFYFILLYNTVWFCHTLTWIPMGVHAFPNMNPRPPSLPITSLWVKDDTTSCVFLWPNIFFFCLLFLLYFTLQYCMVLPYIDMNPHGCTCVPNKVHTYKRLQVTEK